VGPRRREMATACLGSRGGGQGWRRLSVMEISPKFLRQSGSILPIVAEKHLEKCRFGSRIVQWIDNKSAQAVRIVAARDSSSVAILRQARDDFVAGM
ncbi:MAG: hypothetical protein ACREEY_08490, partial [Brevundimonas sp.]